MDRDNYYFSRKMILTYNNKKKTHSISLSHTDEGSCRARSALYTFVGPLSIDRLRVSFGKVLNPVVRLNKERLLIWQKEKLCISCYLSCQRQLLLLLQTLF